MPFNLSLRLHFLLLCVLLVPSAARAQSLAGLWDGTVLVDGVAIPFQIEFSLEGPNVEGAFLNGDQKVTSTSGRFENGALHLNFDEYAEELQATIRDGHMEGTIEGRFGPGPRSSLPFQAGRFSPSRYPLAGNPYASYIQMISLWHSFNSAPPPESPAPSIDGLWEIPVNSPKGESAWRFIVRQTDESVSAAILRADGDTGTLAGSYGGGRFVLSHFSGERPYLLGVTPQKDAPLHIILHDHAGWRELSAYRPADARAKGLPDPADPSSHTGVKDP